MPKKLILSQKSNCDLYLKGIRPKRSVKKAEKPFNKRVLREFLFNVHIYTGKISLNI